jgi:citrate synthase
MTIRKEPPMAAPDFLHPRPDHLARRRLIAPRPDDIAAELGPDVHRGLVGLVADTSAVSCVDPVDHALLYRGYPATELAERRGFLDTAHLLWTGELPTPSERAALAGRERALRPLDEDLAGLVRSVPAGAHPTDVLRTAASWMGLGAGSPPATGGEEALRLLAAMPTVVTAARRHRRGLAPIPPDPELGYAENVLHMSFGEVPEPEVVRAFEVAMVLYADHGFSASTFAARVATSTHSDLCSAVVAGICALKGPLHGGANEAVMAMIADIGGPDHAEEWLRRMLAEKRTIMGFGHRVHKRRDSRVEPLRAELARVAALRDGTELLATYQVLRSAMLREIGMSPNLDLVAGPLFHLIGFEPEVFTSLFAMSRVSGWTAHILEQRDRNALIRPIASYTGPARREVPAA